MSVTAQELNISGMSGSKDIVTRKQNHQVKKL